MAYGLGQWNSKSARAMRDAVAVRKSDGSFDWNAELERQLNQLSDNMVDNFNKYFPTMGISAAIAAHNGPGRIDRGMKNSDGDYDSCRSLSRKNSKGEIYYINSCYFKDEVNAPDFISNFTQSK